MRAQLTIDGIFDRINGHFRPNFFVKVPTIVHPNTIPMDFNDVIHDACAIEIGPAASGDLCEVSRKIAGLGQPFIKPKLNPIIDTVH